MLQKLIVAAPAGSGPAVAATGGAAVAVRDAALLSADGPGMLITGGSANELTRSSVLAAAAGGRGVDVALGATGANLTIELEHRQRRRRRRQPGREDAASEPCVSAGSASITARHVTIAGAATAVALDSSAATGLLSAQGNIAVSAYGLDRAGATSARNNAGLLAPLVPPNTASLALTRTEGAAAPDTLFANAGRRNYHLRADAPVIDKGQLPRASRQPTWTASRAGRARRATWAPTSSSTRAPRRRSPSRRPCRRRRSP